MERRDRGRDDVDDEGAHQGTDPWTCARSHGTQFGKQVNFSTFLNASDINIYGIRVYVCIYVPIGG